MGCCGNLDKNQYEMPYEQIEEFNQLNAEIEEIITNNENPYRKDSNKLLELLNKVSVKISEYEEELDKLKKKKNIDKNDPNDFMKVINSDIKQLKDYYLILDKLIQDSILKSSFIFIAISQFLHFSGICKNRICNCATAKHSSKLFDSVVVV